MSYTVRWLPLILVPYGAFTQCASAMDSPVADAAMNGDRAAVQTLLRKNADVNAPQADGATALEWAAYRDDLR
jgi:ankyrin repeat protein